MFCTYVTIIFSISERNLPLIPFSHRKGVFTLKEKSAKPPKSVIILSVILAGLVITLAGLWLPRLLPPNSFECTNYAMGAYVQQTVYGSHAEEAASDAIREIMELENLISWRIADSDIQKLNDHAGVDWLTIDDVTFSILEQCLDVAEKSDGAFDPTILPLSALWDFGGDNQHLPDAEQIESSLQYVNYQNLRLDVEEGSASLKYHYMGIDLGAVGKGAACTAAVQAYKDAGADAGIIAVGGSVGVFGTKPDGHLWNIAVRDPESGDDKTQALGSLDLDSGFVSTSGSYERNFVENGVEYHHLLNPKTGYPADTGLVSVTVVHSDGTLSDALSTACFVLGVEKGTALLALYGAEGIFIDKDHGITVTDGLKDRFHLVSENYHLL